MNDELHPATKADLRELGEKVAKGDDRITTLDAKVTTLDAKVTTLDTKVAVLDAKVTSLDTKAASLDTKIAKLDGKVDRLAVEFVHLREETRRTVVEEGTKNTNRILDALVKWGERVNDIDHRVLIHRDRLDNLEPRVRSLEEKSR